MIGWLIFGAYVLVGVMRYRVYFERVHVYEADEWGKPREETNTLAFWCALGVMSIWPLWEIQYYLRHFVVARMTKVSEEQRKLAEDKIIEQARDILRRRWDENPVNQRIANGEI